MSLTRWNRTFVLVIVVIAAILGFSAALPPYNVICGPSAIQPIPGCLHESYPAGVIGWELLESAVVFAAIVGVAITLARVSIIKKLLAFRLPTPRLIRICLLAVSMVSLALFLFAATVDISLAGGFDNEVGVQAAHPWLQGFYYWIFPYFEGLVGAFGIQVEELYSPNGVAFFKVFIVFAVSFFTSRVHRGLRVALEESALFASLVLVAFASMVWWASPQLLASKATQFSNSWRLGGVHLLSNLLVLAVSTFTSAALILRKIAPWRKDDTDERFQVGVAPIEAAERSDLSLEGVS